MILPCSQYRFYQSRHHHAMVVVTCTVEIKFFFFNLSYIYRCTCNIIFSRLPVGSTRDGRPGKDSLFGHLESRAPFITPVLTVYVVISLGER
jgi:hypothetical protein